MNSIVLGSECAAGHWGPPVPLSMQVARKAACRWQRGQIGESPDQQKAGMELYKSKVSVGQAVQPWEPSSEALLATGFLKVQ